MIAELIDSLKEFKATVEFHKFDFNAQKPWQSEEIRRILSKKYYDQPEFFGPDIYATPDEKNQILRENWLQESHISANEPALLPVQPTSKWSGTMINL